MITDLFQAHANCRDEGLVLLFTESQNDEIASESEQFSSSLKSSALHQECVTCELSLHRANKTFGHLWHTHKDALLCPLLTMYSINIRSERGWRCLTQTPIGGLARQEREELWASLFDVEGWERVARWAQWEHLSQTNRGLRECLRWNLSSDTYHLFRMQLWCIMMGRKWESERMCWESYVKKNKKQNDTEDKNNLRASKR